MAKQWRVAVIGTGMVGDWHVRVLPKLAETKLVAVCDADTARANASLTKHQLSGVAVYSSAAEMYRKEELDAVHICTPSGNHLEIAAEAMANLATEMSTAKGKRMRIHTPLIRMSKAEIIRRGVELSVDYSLTHSCYDPDDAGRACGECDSCSIRRRGFASAGVADPTVYRVGC